MSNFSVWSQHDEQLFRLGILAEKYFAEAPNTCPLKLRQLTRPPTQILIARAGIYVSPKETQHELLRRLHDKRVLDIRRIGVRGAIEDRKHHEN